MGNHKKTQEGDVTEVTYKFIAGDGENIIPLSELSRETFRQSAKQWEEVANVRYIEVTGNKKADVDVYVNKGMSAAGGGSFPGSGENNQDFVRFNFQPTDSNYSHQVVTHELGHSLGLTHSFTLGDYVENTNNYSIMSYRTAPDIAQGDYSAWPIAPQIDDIAAVQKLYGANTTTRSDDTVYGFNSNTGERELSFSNELKELRLPFSIWDAGGNDTLDFSGFSQNQRIDLNEGKMSDIGGHNANVGIAMGTIIENVIGGNGNDIIIGNMSDNKINGGSGDDIIHAGTGADFLIGGQGNDTFVYRELTDSILSGLGKDASSDDIKDLRDIISINDLSGRYDTIFDFNSSEDKIDLSYLSENGKFDFNLVENFSGKIGEIELQYFSESNTTLLAANINNSQTVGADFAIKIIGHVDYSNDILV